MLFQQNLLEKVYLITKISGLAMVRPASSDFWKAPLVLGTSRSLSLACLYKGTLSNDDDHGSENVAKK